MDDKQILGVQIMAILAFPPEIEAVFREFRTCEFSTLARDGTPISRPVIPFYYPEEGHFLITTSIGIPQKAFHVRRNPRVSLLFSDPTASGLASPPAVLVQGDAEAPDAVKTDLAGYKDLLLTVYRRQPGGTLYNSNRLLRYLFDWYYMRLEIFVTPRRVLSWPRGDFAQAPVDIEVSYVH